MVSPKLLEIERSIRALSVEEQKLLLSRLTRQLQETDGSSIEEQIKAMANDPDIQAEIAAINAEFAVTEMDGLSSL